METGAAILLFGNKPQNFFPWARVRFIRYEGVLRYVTATQVEHSAVNRKQERLRCIGIGTLSWFEHG